MYTRTLRTNILRTGLWLGLLLSLLVVGRPTQAHGAANKQAQANDPTPPAEPVKLIFIHHSTGGNWLADPNSDQPYGGLGRALMENNYFVSATNYGWGPDAIGDRTDIPNWLEWFTGPNRDAYLEALYTENGQNVGDFGAWSRLPTDPGGENEIIMFKSCFPNSDLYGNPDDPPLAAPNDYDYSVENAKAVYNDLLTYFAARQDKLFVVVTAPPLMESETTPERAANARAFNTWLVNEWLQDYAYPNVAVFDYYNVLTAPENHHRWNGSQIEHVQASDSNFSAYPSGDSHPSTAGHQKATAEFVPLLNVWYHRWQAGAAAPPPTPEEQPTPRPTPAPVEPPAEPTEVALASPATGIIEDFEATEVQWWPDGGEGSNVECAPDGGATHGGKVALRLAYDIAAGSWVGCGRYFDAPQDWSAGGGVALWLRADAPGQWATLAVFSGDPDNPTPFETHFELPEDWSQLTFAWTDLPKAEWVGEEGLAALDPARITGLGLSLGADESRRQGVFWVDDIGLAGEVSAPPPAPTEAAPPAPSEEPASEEPGPTALVEQPTAPPQPTASPEKKSGGGGLCGSVALPLGGLVVWWAGARRRRR